MIAGIAAVSSNGMIGMNGWLPWDIPEDVAYFENMIVGAALVVGRRTYGTMAVVPPEVDRPPLVLPEMTLPALASVPPKVLLVEPESTITPY